jgi:hypothetical protein
LMAAAMFSKSTAGAEAGFMAMQLRDEGCSILQLGQAFNCGPAHNHTRDHSGRVWHHFNRGKLGVGTFTLTFTPKGEAALSKALAAVAAGQAEGEAAKPTKKAVKAKGKAKGKKAGKVTPAQTPTSEPATPTEGQPVTVGPELNQQPVVDTPPELGGVDSEHDAVTSTDLQALAAHFNQG